MLLFLLYPILHHGNEVLFVFYYLKDIKSVLAMTHNQVCGKWLLEANMMANLDSNAMVPFHVIMNFGSSSHDKMCPSIWKWAPRTHQAITWSSEDFWHFQNVWHYE